MGDPQALELYRALIFSHNKRIYHVRKDFTIVFSNLEELDVHERLIFTATLKKQEVMISSESKG
jgi:hypothetical protein